VLTAACIGEQAMVKDAVEAARNDTERERAHELCRTTRIRWPSTTTWAGPAILKAAKAARGETLAWLGKYLS